MATDAGTIYGRLEIDIGDSEGKLRRVGRAVDDLNGRGPGALSGLRAIDQHSQSLTTIGQGLLGFGAILTGVSVIAGKTAMDFEAAMDNVAAVSGATSEQMERASDVVLDVGYKTTMSATEAAAALEILIKAGVDLDDALDGVLMSAVNLAEATGVDITLAAETAAAAMNIFGYDATEATRVVDAMSQSANASSLDVNDWALALKYAGPVVAALGWDIEDLAAMMVILGDAGIKGEVGATAIRNILLSLSNPTQEVTDAFAKYNVALFDVNGNLRSMDDITADLAVSWGTMTQSEKLAFAELVAGKQGVTSFTALMEDQTKAVNEGGNAFDRARKRMTDAGTTSEMAQERMDNLKGSIEELKGTVETLMITFMSGLMPVFRKVTDGLSKFLQLFLKLPGRIQTTIAAGVLLTGLMATIGGSAILAAVKLAELVLAFQKLGGLAGTVKILTSSVVGLRTALMSLMAAAPVLLLITAALGGLYLAYKTNFLGFGDLVDGAVSKLRDFVGLFWDIPDQKSIGVTLDTSLSGAEDAWDNWTKMPDGMWKHATLDITTSALPGTVQTIIDNETGATSWTLTVDVDGDGKADALNIIDSVDSGGGKYVMTVEMDGKKYEAWYDDVTGETIIVPMEVELTNEGEINGKLDKWRERREKFEIVIKVINFDLMERLQGISDNALRKLQEMADALAFIGGILLSWSWDAIKNTDAFQWVEDKISSITGLLGTLKSTWDSIFGGGDSDPKADIQGPYMRARAGMGNVYKDNIAPPVRTPYQEKINASTGIALEPMDFTRVWASFGVGQVVMDKLRQSIAGVSDETTKASAPFTGLAVATDIARVGASQLTVGYGQTASATGLLGDRTTATATAIQGAGGNILGTFANLATQVPTQTNTMSASVAGHFLGMQTKSALQMAMMATTASTQGSAMNTGITGWIVGAVARIGAGLGSIPGIISRTGDQAAGNAYAAGANISQSFAAGMYAYLGAIQAAATAMVAAADSAVLAKARIHSPSKMAEYWADMMAGRGFVDRILSWVPKAKDAMALLVQEPSLGIVPGNSLLNPIGLPALTAVPEGQWSPGGQQVTINNYNIVPLQEEEWLRYKSKLENMPATTINILDQGGTLIHGGIG